MEFVIKKKNTKPEFRRLRTVKIVESVERGAKILKQKVISKYLRQMVLSNCTNERWGFHTWRETLVSRKRKKKKKKKEISYNVNDFNSRDAI